MNNYEYQIRISKLNEKDGGGFIAYVPELPGCMSDGETYEEALTNVKDAIDGWIETAQFRGQTIPEPLIYEEDDNYSGKLIVRLPKKLHKELSENAELQGTSLNQLILYYLSKQVGIEEVRTERVIQEKAEIVKVARKEKEIKNYNLFLVNNSNKDWNFPNFDSLILNSGLK